MYEQACVKHWQPEEQPFTHHMALLQGFSHFRTGREVLSHTAYHNVSLHSAFLWLAMRRTQYFADGKVHRCLSLGCVPLTKGHSQRSRFPNAGDKEAITEPKQSWGINGEVLTEMPLSKSAWKCHNVLRVFVICGLSYRLGSTSEGTF